MCQDSTGPGVSAAGAARVFVLLPLSCCEFSVQGLGGRCLCVYRLRRAAPVFASGELLFDLIARIKFGFTALHGDGRRALCWGHCKVFQETSSLAIGSRGYFDKRLKGFCWHLVSCCVYIGEAEQGTTMLVP